MKITDFTRVIAEKEGGKKSLNIGQIAEVLRIANDLTEGKFYSLIHEMKVPVADNNESKLSVWEKIKAFFS